MTFVALSLQIALFSAPSAPAAPTIAAAQPAPAPAPRDAATHSGIVASTRLPAGQEACLDHAVKELGLGAKRVGNAWQAKGELLHARIAAELNVILLLEPASGDLVFTLRTDWPGAPKAAELQSELESRHIAAVARAARICGIAQANVVCQRRPAGGEAVPCTPRW
jgi:hypothetical protein